jgi:hypothetical protein
MIGFKLIFNSQCYVFSWLGSELNNMLHLPDSTNLSLQIKYKLENMVRIIGNISQYATK